MNWTDDNFNELKVYDKMLHSAVYASYVSFISTTDLTELTRLYKEILDDKFVLKSNCSSCVIGMLQRLGLRYFNEKSKRLSNVNTKINKDEDKAIRGSEIKVTRSKGSRPKGSRNKSTAQGIKIKGK